MIHKMQFAGVIIFLLLLPTASAVVVNSVFADTLEPGQEGIIRIEIENILEDDAKDVSLALQFTGLPFIPIGTSEQSADEIEEDEDEDYVFRIKSASDISPGDYEIPYILGFRLDRNDPVQTRTGSVGVKVRANPDLMFTADSTNAIQGQQGQVSLRIVNKGYSDARFVNIRLLPEGFTLLSDDEVYIGTVDSDDFETATFDVLFTNTNADILALVEYVNFDNQKIEENVQLPVVVYTRDKALELGIIQESKTGLYGIIIVVVIIVWLIWRSIKKRRRLKRSERNNREHSKGRK